MMMRSMSLIVASLAMLLASGCANSPPDHFYTLLGDSGFTAAPDGAVNPKVRSAASVVIASVTLPEAVDRSEIVLRSGSNHVSLVENHRWAESLKSAVPRAIANDVSRFLGDITVSVQSDNASRDAVYQVWVDITRFDSVLGESATIEAIWSVRPAAGGKSRTGKSFLRVPVQGNGYGELVAAHAQALNSLSGEIATQIKALEGISTK